LIVFVIQEPFRVFEVLRMLEGNRVYTPWGPWALNGSWNTNTNKKDKKKEKKVFFSFFVFSFVFVIHDTWGCLRETGFIPLRSLSPEWFMKYKHKQKRQKKRKKSFFVFCFFICVCDSWHLRVLEGSGFMIPEVLEPWMVHEIQTQTKKTKKIFCFFCFFDCVCLCLSFKRSWGCLRETGVHDFHDLPWSPWALNGSWITNTNKKIFLFFCFFDCFAPLRGAKHHRRFASMMSLRDSHGTSCRCLCLFVFIIQEVLRVLEGNRVHNLLISRTKETFKRFFFDCLMSVWIWNDIVCFVNISLLYNNILNSWWVVLIFEGTNGRHEICYSFTLFNMLHWSLKVLHCLKC
jgi:hypothetical protein